MSVTSWFLVSSSGTRHRLPREMIFVGRDDCELMLQSRSVDKQHAVINYDTNTDEHMVKDLGSLNGTFVNDLRIPDQTYITLKLSDVIRFGYDAHVYILEKSQHKVPEEALKHEKYTSQLQLSIKALEARAKEKQQLQSSEKSKGSVSNVKLQDTAERRAQSLTVSTDSPISKPTPLYGQPSWWGEDEDPANKKQNRGGKSPGQESPEPAKDVSRYEVNGSLSDSQTKSIFSYRREPSYFEIPTKESQPQPVKKPELQVHEVPTKDTPDPTQCVPSTPTPPVVQSHASFTIEFDECTPGKMKIKDHVTKFSFRQQRKLPSPEVVTTPTEVMSAESKVADWLVQSNASMMRRRSQTEDMYSTNSDPSLLKITKANHREDGTHSDSEDPAINGNDFLQSEPWIGSQDSPQPLRASPQQRFASPVSEEPLSYSPPESQSLSSLCKADPHQAFVIEFFDDNPRKKRSQSFTNNSSPPEPSGLRVQLEKARKSSSPNGERQVPSPASTTPSTQRYTVPLKGPASTGPQRAGSLRREKTEDRISTNFSSRSSSSVSVRPFSSVGRRSKLTQEFTAEFLKQTKQSFSASREKNASSPPTAAKQETVVVSQTSPPPSIAPYQPQTSSPIHQPVPLKAPMMPLASQSMEVKSHHVGPKNEEEDSLSDAGTYTIEADVQDGELEEARSKIDQVFGVFETESPERTNQSEAAFRPVIVQSREQHRQSSSGELRPAPEQGQSLVKVQPAGAVLQGAPKWMSCWASLADSYTESGPSSGLFDIPSQMELSGGARGTIIHKATLSRHHDSTDSDGSRTLRVLPQVPLGEKSDFPTPSIHVHYDLHSTFDVEENSLVAPRFQDSLHRLSVQDDVEPDSLSDASKSDDGSIIEQRRRPLSDTEEKKNEDKNRLPGKSTSFYIGSEEAAMSKLEQQQLSTPKTERKHVTKTFSTATLTKPRSNQDCGKVKPSVSAPILGQGTQSPEPKGGTVSPLIRQESFTKERPSNSRLPNISSQPFQGDADPESFQGVCNQDTHSYLKETEDVLAVLEAKLQAGHQKSEITPSPIVDSLSGESDVDTSSTVSQHSNKTRPNTLTKKPSVRGLHRERSSASIASQSSTSEKRRSQGADSNNKTESVRRPVGLRRSVGKCGSTDLSDDPQSLPYSDQESNYHQTRKKYTVPLQKEDTKTSRVSQVLSRANSFSAPRPTRASMLRRARLGEASDNEGMETDRLTQEAGTAPAKQPQEAKKLSRLDMLAMPRKRTSSFNTPSDNEASSTPQWTGRSTGFSNRSTESGCSSVRRASTPGSKHVEKPQKAALNKTPVTRGRSSSAKYASSTASSRRRQKGSDYTSTSDEEYDSNQSTPKHKRSQPSSASHSPRNQPRPQPQSVAALRPKPRSRDSEEENHEGDTNHNWSNHSAEIARLSQDLAKDLAILAKEIHDVAGDGDPPNPGVESSTPVSTVTTHEQLVHHIPEAGLNYQRVPPSSLSTREPDQSSSDHEQNCRPRARSRDEVIVDNLMLNPVSQIIMTIRENTEELADKIKVLFQDRMDIWEEIEAKVNSDNDVPVGKTSNKEITSILKELRRVQRQLEVINTVMEPSEQPEASRHSAASSSLSGVRPSRPPTSRDFRTVHSASKRGGGPRPGESIRRAAVTPDDLREGYLV
ncbi:centrosomal protein of 170 kDa protein B [Enoplosus armatus]|uniref:centrosomal protein of 170 kDa protein B n=1 Tax=Enoplosus armatus TaxID=215367 RepID=UPI0039963B86